MVLRYCVYILLSKRDHRMYIGYTTNLTARVKDHNKGGTTSTSKRRPLILVYAEFHSSKKDALRRERYFKSTAGKKGLKLMLRESLTELKHVSLSQNL